MRIGRMSEMIGPTSEYETHVTVRCADGAALDRLDAWARAAATWSTTSSCGSRRASNTRPWSPW